MSPTRAIAQREFSSLFRVPVGWIVIALFVFLSGVLFAATVQPGSVASLGDLFRYSRILLLPIAPAISMRLLAEESRSGTLEPLMTSPAPDVSIVVGKFLGAWAFLGAMLAPTLVLVAILYRVSSPAPDPGPIVAGYLSVVLLGGFYLSIGLLASSLTNNQTLAFLGTLLTLVLVLVASEVASERVPSWGREVLHQFSIYRRTEDFARGVIDTSHVVFFVSVMVLCLTCATVVVQSRRWR